MNFMTKSAFSAEQIKNNTFRLYINRYYWPTKNEKNIETHTRYIMAPELLIRVVYSLYRYSIFTKLLYYIQWIYVFINKHNVNDQRI